MAPAHLVVTAAMVVGAFAGVGCATTGDAPAAPRTEARAHADPPVSTSAAGAPLEGSSRPLPPAPPLPPPTPQLPRPVRLTIDSLGIASAAIVPVGVEENGEMEIPGATEVGWYRFGPPPGQHGSAVLAAHIAYDGEDGVFRYLHEVEVGAAVTVGLDDGVQRPFVVTAVERYPKAALPREIFASSGSPQLALVTCGGRFDRSRRSYDDNVVVYARPA